MPRKTNSKPQQASRSCGRDSDPPPPARPGTPPFKPTEETIKERRRRSPDWSPKSDPRSPKKIPGLRPSSGRESFLAPLVIASDHVKDIIKRPGSMEEALAQLERRKLRFESASPRIERHLANRGMNDRWVKKALRLLARLHPSGTAEQWDEEESLSDTGGDERSVVERFYKEVGAFDPYDLLELRARLLLPAVDRKTYVDIAVGEKWYEGVSARSAGGRGYDARFVDANRLLRIFEIAGIDHDRIRRVYSRRRERACVLASAAARGDWSETGTLREKVRKHRHTGSILKIAIVLEIFDNPYGLLRPFASMGITRNRDVATWKEMVRQIQTRTLNTLPDDNEKAMFASMEDDCLEDLVVSAFNELQNAVAGGLNGVEEVLANPIVTENPLGRIIDAAFPRADDEPS